MSDERREDKGRKGMRRERREVMREELTKEEKE
jgi:hypothetical protein